MFLSGIKRAGVEVYYPIKVAILYAIIGGVWIFFSDRMLSKMVTHPGLLTELQTYKGWLFILMTAIVLFILLYRKMMEINKAVLLKDRVNRDLVLLRECNKILVGSKEEGEFLERICKIIVEKGGYQLAWVGFVEKKRSVKPVAKAGFEDGYLESVKITADDSETGRGPTGTAIKTGMPRVMQDIYNAPEYKPWRKEAIKRGYASSIALPLKVSGETIGALNIYAKEPFAFDKEEVSLLEELASDVSYGIQVFRNAERERQMESALFQSQKMEVLGQMVSGVAHDFNNIITVIKATASSLKQIAESNNELRESLNDILEATERAEGLIRQLLIFARKQPVDLVMLNLNDLIIGIKRFATKLLSYDFKLELKLNEDLPLVKVDPVQMQQVLYNLVVNARDAMPEGGTLTIRTEEAVVDQEFALLNPGLNPGRYVVLSVEDTGCGIPEEIMPRIFEPFFTTKGEGKGTGLGLATVYGIVKQHNGYITLTSEVGKGTTFYIYLPAIEN